MRMSREEKKSLAPELRFSGFKDDWAEEQLSNLLDYERPDNFIVQDTNYCESGTPVLTANKSFILGYTKEIDGICTDIPVIIFDDFTVDKKYVNFPFKVKSSAIKILRPKAGNNLKFLYELMTQIKFEAKEHKRYYISAYQNLPVFVPKPKEQQKIADCLSSLDELITAENQKLEALQQHKKGLMQQLFPAEGEKVPKLRFKEFRDSGEWQEKSLGSCLLREPEYGINAPAVPYSKELPTYLRITDISETGHFLSNEKVSVEKEVTENNYLEEGDIVLARTGASVGKSYKYKSEDGRLVFAGFLIRVKPDKEKLYSELLFQLLSSDRYWRWVKFTSARSGQPGINGTEYSSMMLSLPPTLQEQQKVSDCLSSLDNLMYRQNQKIENLKAHKKGLMQQLFPDVNEISA